MSVKGCTKHRRKYADGILYERSIPVTESGCWLWMNSSNSNVYGRLYFNGHMWLAHRLSYETFVGEIGDKMLICHKCDTPSCINPDHLFQGTMKDNMQDASKKGRIYCMKKTHCPQGHEFTPENTGLRSGKNGWRDCKQCKRENGKKSMRAFRERLKRMLAAKP